MNTTSSKFLNHDNLSNVASIKIVPRWPLSATKLKSPGGVSVLVAADCCIFEDLMKIMVKLIELALYLNAHIIDKFVLFKCPKTHYFNAMYVLTYALCCTVEVEM